MKCICFILCFLARLPGLAQSTGGTSVFNFLKHSSTPQLSGLGGINISNQNSDIGLAWHNPGLLRPEMDGHADLVFSSLYGGIKNYSLIYGFSVPGTDMTAAISVNYFNYGRVDETDISGNVFGEINPSDYVIQATVSRQYGTKWFYGMSVKYIGSDYGQYRSNGIGVDLGLNFKDSASLIQAGLTLKNIGKQFKTYTGADEDELPFDLQAGISKKLANAPIQFSLTARSLHSSPLLVATGSGSNSGTSDKPSLSDRVLIHLILAAQLTIAERVELSLGYNHLRRKELIASNTKNGLTGLSIGTGILFGRFKFRYAASYYQHNTSWHQFGLGLRVKDFM